MDCRLFRFGRNIAARKCGDQWRERSVQTMIETISPSALTNSQRLCLRLVNEGMSSKEIAIRTGLTPRTVDQYINRAAQSLGASNRREAARTLARLEAGGLNKLQLQSDALASPVAAQHPVPVPPAAGRQTLVSHLSSWVPPLGGPRHDRSLSQTFLLTTQAALFAAAGFAAIVATAAWLYGLIS